MIFDEVFCVPAITLFSQFLARNFKKESTNFERLHVQVLKPKKIGRIFLVALKKRVLKSPPDFVLNNCIPVLVCIFF